MNTMTPTVTQVLRGDRASRPRVDTTSAPGLRARLEDGVYDLFGATGPATTLTVSAAALRRVPHTTELSSSTLARLRGVLVAIALRLSVAGVDVGDAFVDTVSAWRGAESGALLDELDRLDAEELARLATDVAAHVLTLRRLLGDVPRTWRPRTARRTWQTLGHGRVVLGDTVDLVVGAPGGENASVALLDVTTSPLGESTERVLRYHALLETLRSGTVPLRSAALSTATGEIWSLDVDAPVLQRAVDDLLGVLADGEGR